tara:strand:- start:826 stop:1311 length:486 start_codon:yes stop_codon:yes gene_type:complete
MKFDPFSYQNLFYKHNLKICKNEINQILYLIKPKKLNVIDQVSTFNNLNVLNFPILKNIKKQVTDILDKHKLLLTNNWAQLYNNKNYHNIHNHPNSQYSGIIYINGHSPTIFYDREYQTYINKFVKNQLLLFPSSIPHEVKPLKVDEQRLIVSFNTMKNKK